MTQVTDELFELCKEVYEKTGWKDTHAYYVTDDGTPYTAYGERMNGLWLPKYDSDYLLDRLPNWTRVQKNSGSQYVADCDPLKSWTEEFIRAESDMALKALLKLTLALHEAGELK